MKPIQEMDYLRRHFGEMGARVAVGNLPPSRSIIRDREQPQPKIRIDVKRDHAGEYFELLHAEDHRPEVIDVRPDLKHLVLMVRNGKDKEKYLCGHDERHWFAAAIPDPVKNVKEAFQSLKPGEAKRRKYIRQGEWFFVPVAGSFTPHGTILFNEPLSRGARSKPHICSTMIRGGGETVMVCDKYPTGVTMSQYGNIMLNDPQASKYAWRQMVRDAKVYVRGSVKHADHTTLFLDQWHEVYMSRERFAKHAPQIAFLD